MPTYSLIIENNSGEPRSYCFFTAPPKSSDVKGTVFANTWVKSHTLGSPFGKYSLTVTEDLFAVCGILPEELSPGVVVASFQPDGPVTLNYDGTGGTLESVKVDENGAWFEPKAKISTDVPANSFQIDTAPFDASKNPGAFVGIGKYNENNEVTPVCCWKAAGKKHYGIKPVPTFYVSAGEFKIQQAVEITTMDDVGTYDFSQAGTGQVIAKITHNADGTYSVATFDGPKKYLSVNASN